MSPKLCDLCYLYFSYISKLLRIFMPTDANGNSFSIHSYHLQIRSWIYFTFLPWLIYLKVKVGPDLKAFLQCSPGLFWVCLYPLFGIFLLLPIVIILFCISSFSSQYGYRLFHSPHLEFPYIFVSFLPVQMEIYWSVSHGDLSEFFLQSLREKTELFL